MLVSCVADDDIDVGVCVPLVDVDSIMRDIDLWVEGRTVVVHVNG